MTRVLKLDRCIDCQDCLELCKGEFCQHESFEKSRPLDE